MAQQRAPGTIAMVGPAGTIAMVESAVQSVQVEQLGLAGCLRPPWTELPQAAALRLPAPARCRCRRPGKGRPGRLLPKPWPGPIVLERFCLRVHLPLGIYLLSLIFLVSCETATSKYWRSRGSNCHHQPKNICRSFGWCRQIEIRSFLAHPLVVPAKAGTSRAHPFVVPAKAGTSPAVVKIPPVSSMTGKFGGTPGTNCAIWPRWRSKDRSSRKVRGGGQ